jgi:cytochrome c peroxidase
MTMYSGWLTSPIAAQASVARGEQLFNVNTFNITGVAGLNDALNVPVLVASCVACHDTPLVGNQSTELYFNSGVVAATRRTPDLPLYTLKNKSTGATVQVTDPGRALITGLWSDVGKFKPPVLRGLAGRAPYFHDGSATNLTGVVEFYNTRFNINYTPQQIADLVAFLQTL